MTETGEEPKRFDRPGRVNEITARANRDIVAAECRRSLVRGRGAPGKTHQGRVVHLSLRSRTQFGATGELRGEQARAHRLTAWMPAGQVTGHRQRGDHPGNPEPLGHDASLGAPPGVVAGIVPWNVPNILAALCSTRRQRAGCTVELEPAPEASSRS
jgi:hypothetical protein